MRGKKGGRKESNRPLRHQTIKELSGLSLSDQRSLSRKREKCVSSKNCKGKESRAIGQLTIHSYFLFVLIPLVWRYESPQMRRTG